MLRTIQATLVLAFIACVVACAGGGSATIGDENVNYPPTNSTQRVKGVRLEGVGVLAKDDSDMSKFIANLERAPDISRNLIRDKRIIQIPNGTRVRIIYVDRPGKTYVEVMDGEYAGLKGYMDAGECGATSRGNSKPASAN